MMCGSGVYVRSIARDLGITLNCFGHITKLRRTMVGDFRENESVTIGQLAERNTITYSPITKGDTGVIEGTGSNVKSFIIPIESVLRSMFKVEISPEDAGKIRKGQEIVLNNLRNLKNYDICCTIVGSVPIAICSFIYGCVKPIRVFNI